MDIGYVITSCAQVLMALGICVCLPIMIVWLYYRNRQHETDKQSEIIMTAIEKNGDLNIEDLMTKLASPQKPFNERLINRLHRQILWGTICTAVGILTLLTFAALKYLGENIVRADFIPAIIMFVVAPLAVGIGLLVAYFSGQKLLNNIKAETDE